jgi:glycogen operon protein
MQESDWNNGTKCFGMLLDSRAFEPRDSDAVLLLVFNSFHEPVQFTLPRCSRIRRWFPMLNTVNPDEPQVKSMAVGTTVSMVERSFALFGTSGAVGRASASPAQ